MRIAITGATGFLGRYIAAQLAGGGHTLRCWYRDPARQQALARYGRQIEWVRGELNDAGATRELLEGCDALVHAALHHPGGGFRNADAGDLLEFIEVNLLGSIRLIEQARRRQLQRFVFISTCAVHEIILSDRKLDEAHPLWPTTHYGAHKAAIEKFVHSYGYGQGLPICSLRPTGIYGVADPISESRWFDLVRIIARGDDVECVRGGKEVHAADVARAVELLLHADAAQVTGQAFNCYDHYVSEYDVALLAKQILGSPSKIAGRSPRPRHQIDTGKLCALGMKFGGPALLERTLREIAGAVRTPYHSG